MTAPSAPLPEDFERGEVVNLADNAAERYGTGVTAKGVYMLAKAVLAMDEHITALRARLQDEIAKRGEIEKAALTVSVNRHELIQNGTCAYMSPRPNGLWVNWHYVEQLIKVINDSAS